MRPLSRTMACAVVLIAAGAVWAQTPLGTTITYQGRLTAGGIPAAGNYDFVFGLFGAASGGAVIQTVGTAANPMTLPVTDGLFTAPLNFTASNAFNGDERWLDIQVRPSGSGSYQVLSPRQPLTATPYALKTRGVTGYSLSAVDGSPTDVVYVDNSGNVGVGTTAPQQKLSILNGMNIDQANGNAGNLTNALRFGSSSGEAIASKRTTGGNQFGLDFYTASANRMSISVSGNVGIGNPTPGAKLDVAGTTRTQILQITGGSDIAEPFNVNGEQGTGNRDQQTDKAIQPGMVVSIDPERVGELRVSSAAYDATVAGVISGAGGVNAGLTLQQHDSAADGKHPVALTGRVWCWCDADAGGPIHAGDLLTTSQTPGHAMKVQDRARAGGATLGKAMSSLEHGTGLVLVLVNLQ